MLLESRGLIRRSHHLLIGCTSRHRIRVSLHMMMTDWSDLLAQGKIGELVYGEISFSSYGEVRSDLVQVREYLEVFFGLLV